MIEPPTPTWDEIQRKLPVGSLVSCRITRHAPYGVFAKISGVPFNGLIEITDFKDEGRMTVDEFPAVGSTLTAVVLGFKESGHQVWLGVRPSQIGSVDQTRVAPREPKLVPVGLRVGPDGSFEFFGLAEVNASLQEGARVVGIEPGEAIMTKVGEADDKVRLRLGGFSVHVSLETRGGGTGELE
jgi:predicted RNA-binding protein with RPS1 domain